MAKGKWTRFGDVIWDNPFADTFNATEYTDAKGVVWRLRQQKRLDGWNAIEAKPYDPGNAYGVKADHWPVSGLADELIKGPGKTADFFAEEIDSFVDRNSAGFPWWLLLLILLASGRSSRR